MAEYVVEYFDFNLDFATTGLAAGANTRIGRAAAYTWFGENLNGAAPLVMPPNGYGELAGIEVFPGVANGRYEQCKYIRPIIGGEQKDTLMFTELTAPGLNGLTPDSLGAAGLRYGQMPINIGMPLLMGGNPMTDAALKIAPGDAIEVEIGALSAAEGGFALAQPWTIRLWIAKVLEADKLKEVLQFQSKYTGLNYFDGNSFNCDFDLGDLAKTSSMPLHTKLTGNPIKKQVPSQSRAFRPEDDWTKLPGGFDQDRPEIMPFSVVARQNAVTTANTPFQFTTEGQRVTDKYQELSWTYDKKKALKITHLSLKQPAVGTINQLRMIRSGREITQTFQVQPAKNPFPYPRYPAIQQLSFLGPARLPKPFLVWNEQASIEIVDNGTAITAYSTTNSDSTQIYARGMAYDLGEVA